MIAPQGAGLVPESRRGFAQLAVRALLLCSSGSVDGLKDGWKLNPINDVVPAATDVRRTWVTACQGDWYVIQGRVSRLQGWVS